MNREVGIRHNNDSSTLPFGFNCCAIGLGGRVFTQPGPIPEVERAFDKTVADWRRFDRAIFGLLKVCFGSKPEVSGGNENVRSWG